MTLTEWIKVKNFQKEFPDFSKSNEMFNFFPTKFLINGVIERLSNEHPPNVNVKKIQGNTIILSEDGKDVKT